MRRKQQVDSKSTKTKSDFNARKENVKIPNKRVSILRKQGVEGQDQDELRL
jgi:hypothetical protein